jgi:hypothetical protein
VTATVMKTVRAICLAKELIKDFIKGLGNGKVLVAE